MRNILERITEHPKTTFAGIIMLGLMVLYVKGVIDEQKLAVIITSLAGAGLMVSKDPKANDGQ